MLFENISCTDAFVCFHDVKEDEWDLCERNYYKTLFVARIIVHGIISSLKPKPRHLRF